MSWKSENTNRFSSDVLRAVDAAPRLSLLIYHRDDAQIVPLAPRARMIVGRVPEADISIPEPTLSRHHARIEMIGNDVWIEDLGSSNGTRVNGKRVRKRRKLLPGDDVVLGGVTLSLHATANFSRGLEHHSQFQTLLEEELKRARAFNHQLALVIVRESAEGQLFSQWVQQVRHLLRPVDRLALHSAGTVELLLPETGISAARKQAAQIREAAGGVRCGVAVFPDGGDTAEELLAAAVGAAERADADTPVVTAPVKTPPLKRESSGERATLICGEAMRPVFETVKRVARADLPVLIYGETGSGKEIVARALHRESPRAERRMYSINCGAIPRELVLSELFGHEKGAFTGASQQHRGVFEEASGSTLLLDEVGELPHEAQVALLRVLESNRLTRVGSTRDVPIDVRIVSATHRDLEAMCEADAFRFDLLYRLNTIAIKVPALRQRQDEIPDLARHFVARACEQCGRGEEMQLDENAMAAMLRYQWPGNVRELRNAMERAVLVAPGATITIDDLPDRVQEPIRRAQALVVEGQPMARSDPTPYPARVAIRAHNNKDFKAKVQGYEANVLRRALERCGWNKTAAARALSMPLRTLMNKVRDYRLSPREVWFEDTEMTAPPDAEEEGLSYKERVQRFEKGLLLETLVDTGWNRTEAARQLGLPLSTLSYKINAYELTPKE